jgi:hypothetical protein
MSNQRLLAVSLHDQDLSAKVKDINARNVIKSKSLGIRNTRNRQLIICDRKKDGP